jgi:hypothetical protein
MPARVTKNIRKPLEVYKVGGATDQCEDGAAVRSAVQMLLVCHSFESITRSKCLGGFMNLVPHNLNDLSSPFGNIPMCGVSIVHRNTLLLTRNAYVLFSVICSDGSGYSRKRNLDQERQGRKNGQWYSASSMQLHDK